MEDTRPRCQHGWVFPEDTCSFCLRARAEAAEKNAKDWMTLAQQKEERLFKVEKDRDQERDLARKWHRDNMALAARNVELNAEIEGLRRALDRLAHWEVLEPKELHNGHDVCARIAREALSGQPGKERRG